jgi:hypothetical protein
MDGPRESRATLEKGIAIITKHLMKDVSGSTVKSAASNEPKKRRSVDYLSKKSKSLKVATSALEIGVVVVLLVR